MNLQQLLAPAGKGVSNAGQQNVAMALKAFLAAQHGAGAAGSQALQTAHIGPAAALKAPAPVAGPQGPQPLDCNGIQSFYSDPGNSDYHNDPVLLQVQAQAIRDQADADAQALAGRRDLLTQLGDAGLAKTVLGDNDPTLPAISDSRDSSSVLGRLSRSYYDTTNANEDARNKANLWYSSARAQGLAGDQQDYNNSKADAIASAQQQLQQITGQLSSAKKTAQGNVQTAEGDAYQRYLNAIMQAPPAALPQGGPAPAPPSPAPAMGAPGGGTYTDANSTGYGYAPPKPPKPAPVASSGYAARAAKNSY